MKQTLVTLSGLLVLVFTLPAANADLALNFSSEREQAPLTTEKVWEYAPAELNPHRRIWVLAQETQLEQVSIVQKKGGKLGVAVGGIKASVKSHVRGEGPWYSDLKKFTCAKKPDYWFYTREGAEQAAQAASQLWEKLLREKKLRLAVQLERISEKSETAAAQKAREIFATWLYEVLREYRASAEPEAREAEWKYYRELAEKRELCKKNQETARNVEAPTWKDLMPVPSAQTRKKILARAPARRWNGLYSVRLTVEAGGKRLNGQFLIDSSLPVSLLSPEWLKNQGVLPAILKIPGSKPKKAAWAGGTAVGDPALVDQLVLGGASLPQSEVLIAETALFHPPEYVGSCCDGVLGSDFLRHFAVEFSSYPTVSVILYDRNGFSLGKSTPWVEVAAMDEGELVSEFCEVRGGKNEVQGVRWDTGSPAALLLAPRLRQRLSFPAEIRCSDLKLVEELPRAAVAADREQEKYTRAGMELLGRGRFVFDLGHGRLWFSKDALQAPVLINRSGLMLEFRRNKERERELKVASIVPGSPAASLSRKAGLKVGSVIRQIDNIPADDLDQGEVERRLRGAYGETLTLQWDTKEGQKAAPLKLK